MTSQKQNDAIALLVHLINEHMKEIAIELLIDKPIATYYARHRFFLMRLKVSGIMAK